MFLHDSIHVMPFWPENMEVTLCSLQRVLPGGTEVQSRYCSLWSFPVVKVVSPWESAVFPFVISKSLGGVGIFLKSPLSNSEVSQGRDRMTEIHQNGRSRGCFCQKIWSRSERSEGRCSVIESPEGSEAVLKYVLLGVTGWKSIQFEGMFLTGLKAVAQHEFSWTSCVQVPSLFLQCSEPGSWSRESFQ